MWKYFDMGIREFNYGNYSYRYELIYQDRKTLSLTVKPDMGIIVKCPAQVEDDRINHFLKRKWLWLRKQIRFFEKFQRRVYAREYVSGESFLYLGRQYKLVVKRGKEEGVVLTKGTLLVTSKQTVSSTRHNKHMIDAWYQQRAELIFRERFNEVLAKFDYKNQPELILRKMDKRWGSFIGNRRIILNPRLICASKDCIDYVLTHELCHMRHKKHNKAFFAHLKSKMPDWEKRKDKLEGYLI